MAYGCGGRGNGRGRGGRGGRGRGGRSNGKEGSTNNNNNNNKTDLRFAPQSTNKASASYNTVKEAIIGYIQKTYTEGRDVVRSLKKMTKVDIDAEIPRRLVSRATDEDVAIFEQEALNIQYQGEL